MQKTIYDPSEEERDKELEKVNIKPKDFQGGLFIAYNQDKSLNCAIWGSPKQLACLYLDLQDRMPEGVIKYAEMIRNRAENDIEQTSLGTQAQAHNRLN